MRSSLSDTLEKVDMVSNKEFYGSLSSNHTPSRGWIDRHRGGRISPGSQTRETYCFLGCVRVWCGGLSLQLCMRCFIEPANVQLSPLKPPVTPSHFLVLPMSKASLFGLVLHRRSIRPSVIDTERTQLHPPSLVLHILIAAELFNNS